MDLVRSKIEKMKDGSIFVDLHGPHFTILQLEDIISEMKRIQKDNKIIEGIYELD